MREILFKGRRLDNGKWIEGSYVRHGEKAYICSTVYASYWFDGDLCIGGVVEVDPLTVCQFTGLYDSKRTKEYPCGQPIFEGDILSWDEDEWIGGYREAAEWDYELLDMRKNDWKEYCEVIGNVHD